MTSIAFFVNLFAFVLGILILVILLFSKGKSFAFKLLTVNIFLLLLFIGYSIILSVGWLQYVPHLFKVPVTFALLLGPVSYLFIRSLLKNEKRFLKNDWVHFVPFLFYFLELVPFFLHTKEYKLNIIKSIDSHDLIKLIEYEVGYFPNRFHTILLQLSNFIYVIATANFYRSHCKRNLKYSQEELSKRKFAFVVVIVKVASIFVALISIYFYKSNSETALLTLNTSMSTMLISLVAMLFVNPDYLYGNYNSIVLSNNQKELNNRKILVQSSLQAMTNSTTESNVFLDKNCVVLYFNVLAEKRIRLVFNQQIKIGDDFNKYVQKSNADKFNLLFEQAINGHTNSLEIQQIYQESNLAEWFKVIMMPVYKEDETFVGVSLKIVNIDKMKRLEIENQAYIHKLEAIAWQEAHILRAPIANLIGLSKLLKKGTYNKDKEKRAVFINQIYQEVERLNKNITEITNNSNQIILESLNQKEEGKAI